MFRKLIISIILTLLSVSQSLAAYHYIRPGPGGNYGSEDGSDWANAYDGFPATYVRGDTYYIAGGEYEMDRGGDALNFNTAESGSTYIYFKKANADGIADAASGWNSSFASTQAELYNSVKTGGAMAIRVSTGYWDWDGITGSGDSGHGILVRLPNDTSAITAVWLVWHNGDVLNNINFNHIAFHGMDDTQDVGVVLLYNTSDNDVIQNCYFKDFAEAIQIEGQVTGVVISNNYFIDQWQTTGNHGNTIDVGGKVGVGCPANGTIKNNKFLNLEVSSVISIHGRMEDVECSIDDFEVYNNVFAGVIPGSSNAIGTVTNGCTMASDGWKIYNNTFYEFGEIYMPQNDSGCTDGAGYVDVWPATNWEVKNNIFFETVGTSTDDASDGIVYDYNYYNDVDAIPTTATNSTESTQTIAQTFIDYTGKDFSLVEGSGAIDAGTDLSSYFTTDINGNTRIVPWDIGAYEYQEQVWEPGTGEFENGTGIFDPAGGTAVLLRLGDFE